MRRQLSRMTKLELTAAVGKRYRSAAHEDKKAILDEFVEVTGYHRKHAIRLLRRVQVNEMAERTGRRIYSEAVREALIILWEAADRICGKRLRALIPVLLESMEKHGHLHLGEEIRKRLLSISAATIDRLLIEVRKGASGSHRTRGIATALRRSIPVRTFADWKDPSPGYMEADLVAHCGGVMGGSFVHSFVLTDVATGWTECVALIARDQNLIVEGIRRTRARLPFPLQGFDTDNDSAFINETVVRFCREAGIEFTRSRAYRKNDQAWVEQKNGAVVRKLVGYGRLTGSTATRLLSSLYEVSRCYVNFFQPSFKLKSKTRTGAKVSKVYHPPVTPYGRLLASNEIPDSVKEQLRLQFAGLDPIQLLQQIRRLQSDLAASERGGKSEPSRSAEENGLFVRSLRTAWQSGEIRPTHRKSPRPPRTWRTRRDPFETVWSIVLERLEESPDLVAKELFQRLQVENPGVFPDCQLRTLQRRVKEWRSEMARRLIMSAEELLIQPNSQKSAAPNPLLEGTMA
jgi:hypothetical protein